MPSPHLALAQNEPGPAGPDREFTAPIIAADAAAPPGPDADEPNPRDGQLTDVVTRRRRALRTGLRAEYTWESLPMPHVDILHTLAEQPGIRVCDVAVELRLAQSTVASLIRQMAADGLVERTPAPADRRIILVSLSQKGIDQLTGWQAAHRERIAAALNKLAVDEQLAIGQAPPALDLLVDELNVR